MPWRPHALLAAALFAASARAGVPPGLAADAARTDAAVRPHAQNGEIAGRVTGPEGNGLAGVEVTIAGSALPLAQSAITSALGTYWFTGLPAGTYSMAFDAVGFARRQVGRVEVAGGLRTAVDARLSRSPARDDGLDLDLPGAAGGAPRPIVRTVGGRFAGSASFLFADQRLQSGRLPAELEAQGAGLGSPLHRLASLHVEAGGPLLRGRAWVFGEAGRAVEDVGVIGFYVASCLDSAGWPLPGAAYRAGCLEPDVTTTTQAGAELQYRWTPRHRSIVRWDWSHRTRPARGASAYTRLEATTRESSRSAARPLRVEHQAALTGRVTLDATVAFSDASFALDFQDPSLAGIQGAYDRYSLLRWRSATRHEYGRPAFEAAVSGAWRVERWTGGSHALRFGAGFASASRRQRDQTGGGAVAVFDSRGGAPAAYQARIVRDGRSDLGMRTVSLFLQDTFVVGRVAFDAGLAFARQDDEARAAAIPANPVLPDLLPAVRFDGADSGVVYRDLSPRAGLTWDVTGGGRTIVRARFTRSVGPGHSSSAALQPTGQTRLVYWWSDADGDGVADRDELDLARGPAATPSANYDAASPASVRSPATVDPRLESPVGDEWSVRLEQPLGRRLTARVAYVGRLTHRVQRTFRVDEGGALVSSASFTPVAWLPACPATIDCPAVTYYERADPLPAATVLRNDGERGWRHAVVLSLHKRMHGGWMLDASARWEAAAWSYPRATFDYTDPTNIAARNGAEDESLGSHWTAEAGGSARLPWGLSVSGTWEGRQGRPFARGVTTPNRGALGSIIADLARYGSERYPPVWQVDCRVERRFRAGRVEVVPALWIFNLLNASAVLARNRVQNAPTANAILAVQPPRSARLEMTMAW